MSQEMWVYDEVADSIVKRAVTFVPGLYKIFDEIIVNAADNKQRDENMSKLKVTLDAESGKISVWNDGAGIPIQMHKEHHIYVPELIFGNLLTGSNFDDDQKKTTGGRNGFGAKLANIYSTEFVVETADRDAGKHYRQVFRNNMQEKQAPEIDCDYEGPDFTCITFTPDWKRFHMTGMESDTIALLRKRVYDMAGCMGGYAGATVKVYLDNRRVKVSGFKDYMSMYEGMETPVIFESIGDRWEVGVAASADSVFQQVSYVNAICTVKGGTHVECVANQVINKLLPVLKRKHKAEVKGHFVKNHLCVFVNGLVENPAFNSQSKEALTSKDTLFGSVPKISDAGLKKLEKSEIVDRVLSWAKHKQNQQLNKKSGKKSSKLTGITKLDDANHAGTAKSQDCTLILTEGDSAKTLAVSGLGVVGRDRYGVFPLKGKLLNVREATGPQVLKNEEIQNVVKILGLKFNHKYDDTKQLRYGHLMIMTDQDHDGSHIKGLLINFVHHYWPSLLKIDGFLQEFITPIVKVSKGRNELSFYTVPEYTVWKEGHANGKGWNAKYYKGLGTSTAKEAKEYFAALDTHQLEFEWQDDHRDDDLIDMAFSKKRVEDRKEWLRGFKAGTHADYNVESVTYESFINKELILFSMEDNKRSIPCLVDGFKPSQRKVLFSCFKRNLRKEIKVVQLAGYVSEHSAYHHGEASLNGTITAMAQNFTGSNNLNLLTPGGQFGTRLMGGKDAASPRYIFTALEKAARAVFHPDDDALLTYLDDDGLSIEPEFYMPIIPLILVNGSDGIGTGWSSNVPNYSPHDVIENLKRRIKGDQFVEMQPWYKGFAGSIEAKVGKKGFEGSYTVRGIVNRVDDTTVEITELPVRKWTQDYKQFLESLLPGAEDAKSKDAKGNGKSKGKGKGAADKDKSPTRCIKDFKENHTDTTVHFTVTMSMEDLDALDKGDGLYKFFKLESSVSTNNMVLFDQDGHLERYESPQHIMEEFITLRSEFYDRRKTSLLNKLQSEWSKLDNKVRFILAVVEDRMQVNNRKKSELLEQLKREGYDLFLPATSKLRVAGSVEDGEGEDGGEADDGDTLSKGYDYLLGMKIWSLTLERVKLLENELEAKTEEMRILKATAPSELWLKDLDALGDVLDEIDEIIRKQEVEDAKQRKNAGKRKGGGRGRGRGAQDDDGDSDFEEDGGFGKKKKASKAKATPPPPPPTRAPVPELVFCSSGGKVSPAFGQAESMGKFFAVVKKSDEDVGSLGGDGDDGDHGMDPGGFTGSGGSGHGDQDDSNGDDDPFDDDGVTAPTRQLAALTIADGAAKPAKGKKAKAAEDKKKKAAAASSTSSSSSSMSLAARVKHKFGDTTTPAPKLPAKPKRPATRKPPSTYVDSSDNSGSDDDFHGMESVRVRTDGLFQDEEVVAEPVVKPSRPGRAAAKNRKPIVDVMSDDEEEEEAGFDEDMGDSDDFHSAEENDSDDGYEPTPAKARKPSKAKGRPAAEPAATAAAAAAARKAAVETKRGAGGVRGARGKTAVAAPEATTMLSSDHEEEEDGDSDGCEVVEAEPAVAPVRGGRGGRATAGKGRAAAKVTLDSDEEDDVFAMEESDEEAPPPPARAKRGGGKGRTLTKAGGAAATKGKGGSRGKAAASKAAATTTPAKSKGVKRGKRNSLSDEGDVFSPQKMSPPMKRASQKSTPAASRLRANKPLADDSDSDKSDSEEDDDSDVVEVTKTPRPARRAGRTQKVVYAELDSDESEQEEEEEEDDDESEFEG
ncbi:unnamed protein product [Ectocarpus sp. CCAP 1310/34]|nr:unnamed protein product [Ectocarpus sp. CCAP 1310/34]